MVSRGRGERGGGERRRWGEGRCGEAASRTFLVRYPHGRDLRGGRQIGGRAVPRFPPGRRPMAAIPWQACPPFRILRRHADLHARLPEGSCRSGGRGGASHRNAEGGQVPRDRLPPLRGRTPGPAIRRIRRGSAAPACASPGRAGSARAAESPAVSGARRPGAPDGAGRPARSGPRRPPGSSAGSSLPACRALPGPGSGRAASAGPCRPCRAVPAHGGPSPAAARQGGAERAP